MDPNHPNQHRRGASSERFLSTFSPPSCSPLTTSLDDLCEDDILFTTPTNHHPPPPSSSSSSFRKPPALRPQRSFKVDPPSGILAALPDVSSSSSSSRTISIIPPSDHSLPSTYHQSAPLHVPPIRRLPHHPTFDTLAVVDDDDDDDEMLPPHELVARRLPDTPLLSTSVLEGAGRTLKGRDLRQLITMLVIALTFARIELTLCSDVKGSVSCSDCGPDYDFTGIRILVKCDQVKKLSEAIANRNGNFETTLPSETSSSPKCLAKVLGGSSQLYATKQHMTSEIILAQGDKKIYTVRTPLIVSKSCHGKCGTRRTDFSSSKTIDLPFPPEFGLPPTSYFTPFIPIIGIP